MVAPPTPRIAGPAPAGAYLDPCDRSGQTLRTWDGEAWTTQTAANDADVAPTPPWHRRPFAFLGHRPFHLLVLAIVLGVLDAVLFQATKSTPLLVVLAAASATAAALAFGSLISSRLGLRQVVDARTVVALFFAGGVVGQLIVQLERLLPKVATAHWSILLVGPIEETAKLAVPLALVLWGPKRFRDPRTGLVAVLASAAAFGVAEAVTIALRAAGEHGQPAAAVAGALAIKPLVDPVVHMSITGIFGAVAWHVWHREGRPRLTGAVLGALLGVMAAHDLNDAIDNFAGKAGALLGIALLVGVYVVFKHSARALVPPDNIEAVPPGWRPKRL